MWKQESRNDMVSYFDDKYFIASSFQGARRRKETRRMI